MSETLLNMISAFLEVFLILLFVFTVLGLVIGARRGYKRGIYKSTYMMVGYILFFILALVTMKPLTRMVMNLPLKGVLGENLNVTLPVGGKAIEYSVNVSTVEGTLTDIVTGFCNAINASDTLNVSINKFAKTIVFSIVSFTVYAIDLNLILLFGGLFLQIMWLLFFKKLTPKVAQRMGKIRFIGLAEGLVTSLIIFFLSVAPFTSIMNSINQGIQKSNARNSQNKTVQEIVNLVDIYNDSLFAQAFFNWNTGLTKDGITFDQGIMDYFAKTLNGGDDAFSLGRELGNLAGALGEVASVLGDGKDGIPTITEYSTSLVNPIFDLVGNSDLFNSMFQITIELALNSDLLVGVVPNYQYFERVDISDISLDEELEVFKGIANDIIDSKIIEDFVSEEDGVMQFSAPQNMIDYLDDLFTVEANRPKVNKLFNVFNRLDDFKLLKACFQSMGYWMITFDDSYSFVKYLGGNTEIESPYDDEHNRELVVDFIKEFNIGHEMYIIFDSFWGLAACGDHVIKNAYNSFRAQLDSGETKEEYEAQKKEAKTALAATLRTEQTTSNFRDAICGINHMNPDGTAQDRDSTKGEHYALMDSKLFAKFINDTPFMKNFLTNMELEEKYDDYYPEVETRWNNLMNEVYTEDTSKPLPIKFFKEEVNHILTVITNVIQLQIPTSTSSSPAVKTTALSGQIDPEQVDPEQVEEDKPFEYIDYPSFLDAAINLFDGWINKDDVVGSALDLDSRIAPYLGKAFECLTPLDESKIVYALGIPMIEHELSEHKETTGEFFDLDICIYQIDHSNDLFTQLAQFLDGEFISCLQHFYVGFLMNDEGKFDLDVFKNSMSEDMNAFLRKFNEHIEIKPDNPDTIAYDPVLDEQPLKYYFSSILKKCYNFEIFNPHEGEYKNKNMQNMFNYIFGNMEEEGVERPSDEIYAQLDPPGKWEAELDAITNLFGVLGENNMLKFSEFSSSVNSTLLYSLAGDTATASTLPDYDPEMPRNLGVVMGAVGDSILFSNAMGGLLDNSLDGTLCDSTIGVSYKNINSGEYWHQEGDNMSALLLTMAKLDLDLENLNFTEVTDVVGLNDMLHKLSDSLIFRNAEEGNKFGEWLHKKVDVAMQSMGKDLLNDPEYAEWDNAWDAFVDEVDNTEYPEQKIAHYDFLVRDGYHPSDYENNKKAWSNDSYDTLMAAFKEEYNYEDLGKIERDELYLQPGFLDDYYDKVLKYDELGRVVNVMGNGIKIKEGNEEILFSQISAEDLDYFLTAVNNSNCLRIAAYNAMKNSKDSVGTNDFADIERAQFEYLVAAGADILDYENGRINRQIEIDHIIEFITEYKELQRIAGDDLGADAFFTKATLMEILGVDNDGQPDPNGKDHLIGLLAGLQATHCFNLDAVSDRASIDMSFFEDMMVNLMGKSGLTELCNSDDDEMITRVKKLSNHDMYGTVNNEGYNSVWTESDGINIIGGENACISSVFKSVINATSGDTVDANNVSLTELPAAEVTDIMKAVNSSYLCTGAMNRFVKDAFSGDLGLEELLKYDSADTEMIADFDLNYLDYGGTNNNCGEGTEIYCIYRAIDSMQYQEPGTGEYKFVDLDDFEDSLSKKGDFLDGVFYFLYNSKTLAKTEERDSTIVKGRSVMLYNALDNFDSYLIGTNKPSKIDSMEKIFDVSVDANNEKAYLVEANGLTRLIDDAGNTITDVDVDNLRTDDSKRNMILNVIKYSYDRTNDGNVFSDDEEVKSARAYFTSEIVAGIFDNVLTTEYATISASFDAFRIATFDDYERFYFADNGAGGKATCANDITVNTFNNLNEVERVGLEGAIDMTNFINREADRTGTDLTNIADNAFVVGVLNNKTRIRQLFTEYFHNVDEDVDSRFAKILFISRCALSVEKETATYNDVNPLESGLFVMLKYTHVFAVDPTTHPSDCIWKVADGYTEDYYGNSFSFDVYGNDLMDYIEDCAA